jgi:hypothetical protein
MCSYVHSAADSFICIAAVSSYDDIHRGCASWLLGANNSAACSHLLVFPKDESLWEMLLELTTSYRAVKGRCCTAAAATSVSLKYLALSYLHTALADELDRSVGIAAAAAASTDKLVMYQPIACILANCCAESRTAVAHVTIYCSKLLLCTGAPLAGSAADCFYVSGAWRVRDATIA